MNTEIQKFLTHHLGTDNFQLSPIQKGGSDRVFFRVFLPDKTSFIFMHYGDEVVENFCWIEINRFLAGINVAVPQIMAQDAQLHFILVEDLGDIDLWSQRTLSWDKRRMYYYQALQEIRKLHSFELARLPSDWPLAEGYTEKLYQWEHNYFLENFVAAVCQLEMSAAWQKELNQELNGLIVRMQQIEPCLIHRDFQSQNILLKNGRPVLIDFQGMRRGSPFYDLGSLLFDPYVIFTDNERNELATFYYDLMNPSYSLDVFINNFREAAAQRLMQALGAYGYLGLKKSKPDFLQHINNGCKNLLAAASLVETLPVLRELANSCIQKLDKH